jgi:hypothetical protein
MEMESRVPKVGETVSAFGHKSAFTIESVDLVNKTVDIRTLSVPSLVLRGVSFTTLSYDDGEKTRGQAAHGS